jgi:hypothetical protein
MLRISRDENRRMRAFGAQGHWRAAEVGCFDRGV